MDGFETGPEVIDRLRSERNALERELTALRRESSETERKLEDRVEALTDLIHWLDRRCGLGLDARLRIAQVLKEGR